MPQPQPIPAFVPCHPKDLPTLPYCIQGLQSHPQVGPITVVAPAELEAYCKSAGVGFLDERTLLRHWYSSDPTGNHRWYYQMYLKLSVAFLEEPPERFLIIDADTVFLHPFPLTDLDGTVLHPRMTERYQPYYTGISELFGREIIYDGSYIAHFMVLRSDVVRKMFEEFARVKGVAADQGGEVLREFLTTCDRHTKSFCDYDAYGHFAAWHQPGEIKWVRRRQLNVLFVRPSVAVLERLRRHYDYCSFHAYRRPDSLLARLVGGVWLGQRLLRDRVRGRTPELGSSEAGSVR